MVASAIATENISVNTRCCGSCGWSRGHAPSITCTSKQACSRAALLSQHNQPHLWPITLCLQEPSRSWTQCRNVLIFWSGKFAVSTSDLLSAFKQYISVPHFYFCFLLTRICVSPVPPWIPSFLPAPEFSLVPPWISPRLLHVPKSPVATPESLRTRFQFPHLLNLPELFNPSSFIIITPLIPGLVFLVVFSPALFPVISPLIFGEFCFWLLGIDSRILFVLLLNRPLGFIFSLHFVCWFALGLPTGPPPVLGHNTRAHMQLIAVISQNIKSQFWIICAKLIWD